MILWKKEYIRPAGTASEVVYKRHECEWLLPQEVAAQLKFNPRHLPMVIQIREKSNEAYYLYLSIRRIIFGYRARREQLPLVQWYKDQP